MLQFAADFFAGATQRCRLFEHGFHDHISGARHAHHSPEEATTDHHLHNPYDDVATVDRPASYDHRAPSNNDDDSSPTASDDLQLAPRRPSHRRRRRGPGRSGRGERVLRHHCHLDRVLARAGRLDPGVRPRDQLRSATTVSLHPVRSGKATFALRLVHSDSGSSSGIYSDPGVSFPWRSVTSSDVWDDDPSSPLYNQWVNEAVSGVAAAGADPEPMEDAPFYDYGAVIDYNTDPVVPYAGSAIFLHVSDGSPTVGCVALPEEELLPVLKWLNPADSPRIIMGTESAVVS